MSHDLLDLHYRQFTTSKSLRADNHSFVDGVFQYIYIVFYFSQLIMTKQETTKVVCELIVIN